MGRKYKKDKNATSLFFYLAIDKIWSEPIDGMIILRFTLQENWSTKIEKLMWGALWILGNKLQIYLLIKFKL